MEIYRFVILLFCIERKEFYYNYKIISFIDIKFFKLDWGYFYVETRMALFIGHFLVEVF